MLEKTEGAVTNGQSKNTGHRMTPVMTISERGQITRVKTNVVYLVKE